MASGRIAMSYRTKPMAKPTEPTLRMEGGVITSATRTPSGGLNVTATFLAEGPLVYQRADGSSEEEYLPWESITDPASLETAKGSPILYGHPARRNKEVKADEWVAFGKGMTAAPIYLHRPFASIACHIGDADLAARVESGDVTRVSSCRSTRMRREGGQLIQGAWQQNHLAFLPKGVNPRQKMAKIHREGGDLDKLLWRADSDEETEFDIPDYSQFELVTLDSGLQVMQLPIENIAKNNPIILQVRDDEDDAGKPKERKPMNEEEIKALTTAVGAGLSPLLEKLTTGFDRLSATVGELQKPEPKADDAAPVFSEAEVAALTAKAAAEGAQRGRLLGIAAQLKVDDAGLADASIGQIATKIIGASAPAMPIDGLSDEALFGVAISLQSTKADSEAVPPAPKKTGKPVPKEPEEKADSADADQKPGLSAAQQRQLEAIKKQRRLVSK